MSGRRSNHDVNWARFLMVLLFQRGSGIDTDSRAKFSGQQVFWAKIPARAFPIEGWELTCTCCIWEVPRNDRKVFPPTSSIGILPGLPQKRTYQPEGIEPTQRGQVPKRFSRPIGRIGLLYRRRLTIDTESSCYTDEGQLSDSKQTTTIQRSRIEV